ncbi:MAG: nuclear transport factor 2 family protein [Pseudomonadota bacterium]
MTDIDLAARIQRLEDIEAIRVLKARYCEVCDDDHNPDDIVTLFAPDGIWEGEGIGRACGHDELRELFTGFAAAISFSQHMVHNPIIEVHGDRATGRWYFFGTFTMREGGQALWQACRYHEDYRRIDGAWKIQHLRVRPPQMRAKYEKPWRNGTRG